MEPTAMPSDPQRDVRREVITLALDRRPTLTPPDLLRILRKLDLPLTPAMLAEDLRACGVQMVPQADGSVVLERPRPPEPEPEPEPDPDALPEELIEHLPANRPVRAVVSAPTAAEVVAGGLDDAEDEERRSRRRGRRRRRDRPEVLVPVERGLADPFAAPRRSVRPLSVVLIVLGVLVVIASVVAWLATGSDGEEPAATTTTTTGEGPRVAPSGPGADPDLFGTADATDEFTRSTADGLGEAEGLGPWTVLGGDWRTEGGQAVLDGGPAGAGRLAVVDVGTPDVRAQVVLVEPVMGAGLVFRAVDAGTYWLWAAAPGFRTFTLYRVVDGVATSFGDSGITEMGPGVRIGVNAVGSTLQLLANGVVVHEVQDPDPTAGSGLGLGALPEVTSARFDDLALRRGG